MAQTDFQLNTETLRKSLEGGDIAKICKKAKCTTGTLFSAWKRTNAIELTKKERAAYDAFISYVSDKRASLEQLNTKAAQVAAELTK